MTRFCRLTMVCTVVGVLVAGTLAAAQPPKAEPGQPRRVIARQGGPGRHVMRGGQSGVPSLPGYYQLARTDVQKELELVPDQIEKLKEIGKGYYEEMQANRDVWKGWREMSAEERKAKQAEMRESYQKRRENVKAAVEKILLPHQVDMLKQISFRSMAPNALRNPRTLEQLGISEEQKKKLEEIRNEMTEAYKAAQKKAADEALKVLSAEQQEKLKEQIQARGY